ncbi:STAS domain-containing protein [Streptomyces sp. NPDC001828]|uniref:STAS domain-containing protein n=1 Tax=Streptomyces sp. NPDC001828 TaxID=3364615 RepID=UPI0036BB72FB
MSSPILPTHPSGDAAPTQRPLDEALPGLRITSYARAGRVTVAVGGEIDLDTAPQLHHALINALRRSPCGVDVDLGGAPFCDCAGVNTLLHARRYALDHGKTLVVRNAVAPVVRLLTLTHTLGPLTSGAVAPTAVLRQRQLDQARPHSERGPRNTPCRLA